MNSTSDAALIEVHIAENSAWGEAIREAFSTYAESYALRFAVGKRLGDEERPAGPKEGGNGERPELVIAEAGVADTATSRYDNTVTPIIVIGRHEELPTFLPVSAAVLPTDEDGRFATLLPPLARRVLHLREQQETGVDMLRHTERRHRDLLNAVPDIVYRLSPDGKFLFVNEAIRSLGYEPDELLGRHFSILLPEDELTSVARDHVLSRLSGTHTGDERAPRLFDERRRGDRRTRNLEIRLVPKNATKGETKTASVVAYGEVSAVGHYRNDGTEKHFVGTVGIIRDITLRRKSEQLLRNLATAMEQTRSGLCIVTGEGTIAYANHAFGALHGLREHEITGKAIWDIGVSYFATSGFFERIRRLELGDSFKSEFVGRSGSGKRYWAALKVSPVAEPEGSIKHYVIEQEDETKAKQRFLRQMKDLREKDALVHELHHRVGNNLQTVLSIISLQATTETHEQTLAALERLSLRIQSLAQTQDLVYDSEDLGEIEVGEQLRQLANQWRHRGAESLQTRGPARLARTSAKQAVPLGIIAEEFLQLRHDADTGCEDGDTIFSWWREGRAVKLSVEFGGPALRDQRRHRQPVHESMTLVEVLTEQLNAEVEWLYDTRNRATLSLTLPHAPNIPDSS